jgi:hypothetical protein
MKMPEMATTHPSLRFGMSANPSSHLSSNVLGQTWIAVGLAIMVAGVFFPIAPMVTAIALIALGATEVLMSRQHANTSAWPLIVLQSTTYALLYALFIGARLHTPAEGPGSSLTLVDFAVSTLPMALALRRILACLRTATLSRP